MLEEVRPGPSAGEDGTADRLMARAMLPLDSVTQAVCSQRVLEPAACGNVPSAGCRKETDRKEDPARGREWSVLKHTQECLS